MISFKNKHDNKFRSDVAKTSPNPCQTWPLLCFFALAASRLFQEGDVHGQATRKAQVTAAVKPGTQLTPLPWDRAGVAEHLHHAERSHQKQSSDFLLRSIMALPKSSPHTKTQIQVIWSLHCSHGLHVQLFLNLYTGKCEVCC